MTSVRLGKTEIEPEIESQVQGESKNQHIATEEKKFSLLGGGSQECRGLLYVRGMSIQKDAW